ncbi:MAG: hypothetical protein NC489_08855 [Ruminococcus flavefaciens]|nr:hypothetical protein [Ruminococcus flavefaciens]
MRNPIRAYEFAKTFDQDTTILVRVPPDGLSENLKEWSDKDLYKHTILSADLRIMHGKIVVGVYVSMEDTSPTLFPQG